VSVSTRNQERQRLAEAFDKQNHRHDGLQVAVSLDAGLTILRDCLYLRLHEDLEQAFGKDSMLVPVSEAKTQLATKAQIEAYQAAESALAVRTFKYVADGDWYLQWLTALRQQAAPLLASQMDRAAGYMAQSPDQRRLALTDVLAKALPESRQAPLVVFRLLPLAVQIATALSFGDQVRASELRAAQRELLPAITGCHQCHGRVLANEEPCPDCGNPLWKIKWLTLTD
jgi:hypothetical protein